MNKEFQQLPDEAKLWVFRSKAAAEPEYLDGLKSRLKTFIQDWESHGHPVLAGFKVIAPHFILVSAISGEENPSGCSTDKLVRFFEEENQNHGIDWLNNSEVFFQSPQGWESIHFSKAMEKIAVGAIKPDTLLANLQLSKKGDFPGLWLQKAEDSWMKRNFASVKS